MSNENQGICEIQAESAAEFWEILSPQRPLFDEPSRIIYRGQANSEWSLEPTIFREKNRPKGIANNDEVSSDLFVFYELRMLQEFTEAADSIGIALPNDSKIFRGIELKTDNLDKYKKSRLWPGEKLYDLIALAQHYGMPTCFLDWS